MYIIQKENFGLRITLSGEITVAEMVKLKSELATILTTLKRPFGTIVNIRNVIPPKTEVNLMLQECEQMTRDAGLQRRAVIFQSPVIGRQAKQLSFKSKTDCLERQINASLTDDWKELAIAWVVEGIEPSFTAKIDSGFI